MKALMSEKLREIISDPEGNRELQKGLSKLSAVADSSNESTEISVGNVKYKIKFVQRNSDKNKG